MRSSVGGTRRRHVVGNNQPMKHERQPFTRGIYNYCDHWCERCQDRARCRLWFDESRSRRRRRNKGQAPDGWEAVVQDVTRSFEKVKRTLMAAGRARGLDLEAVAKKASSAERAEGRRAMLRHPLGLQGSRYCWQCTELVKILRGCFQEAGQDAASRSDFLDVRPEAKALDRLREAARVLSWDSSLVFVKTCRALEGWFRAKAEAGRGQESSALEDAYMTAAVALRCLKRDEAALRAVYEWDEKYQSPAIDLLASGKKIARGLEEMFPGAAALARGRKSLTIGH